MRSTSHAHQVYLRTQIAEGEAVLSILRKKAEDAETRLQQADSQLGSLRGHLRLRGVPALEVADEYMNEFNSVEHAYAHASPGSSDCGEDGEAVSEVDEEVGGGAEASGASDGQ